MTTRIPLLLIALSTLSSASALAADSYLSCKFTADPKSSISVGVDEATHQTETVLLGVTTGDRTGTIQSALLRAGSVAKQIAQGAVVIAFADDADPKASEIFDAALFAVARNKKTGTFDGYLSVQDDGLAVMSVTCNVKK